MNQRKCSAALRRRRLAHRDVDAAGYPHLTYAESISSTAAHLKYAYFDSSAWHFHRFSEINLLTIAGISVTMVDG